MSTKNAKPLSVTFYLAEDLRQEQSGLITAVGLYPDKVIVVGRPSNAALPSVNQPIGLKSLGFLFNIRNLTKSSLVSVELTTGTEQKILMPPQKMGPVEDGKSISLIAVAVPMLIQSFGTKYLLVKVGKEVFNFEFEVRDGAIQKSAATMTPAKKAVKRKP